MLKEEKSRFVEKKAVNRDTSLARSLPVPSLLATVAVAWRIRRPCFLAVFFVRNHESAKTCLFCLSKVICTGRLSSRR